MKRTYEELEAENMLLLERLLAWRVPLDCRCNPADWDYNQIATSEGYDGTGICDIYENTDQDDGVCDTCFHDKACHDAKIARAQREAEDAAVIHEA